MEIKQLCKDAYENSKAHGFYDYTVEEPFNLSEKLMLIVSELGEAQEAYRTGKAHRFIGQLENFNTMLKDKSLTFDDCFKTCIKDCFCDEIADAFIRLGDLCGYLDIDIENYIDMKMQYNRNRPYKHGKKF
jgi:NTP pyrophosphatase (non-canonical NTP hydrolase)